MRDHQHFPGRSQCTTQFKKIRKTNGHDTKCIICFQQLQHTNLVLDIITVSLSVSLYLRRGQFDSGKSYSPNKCASITTTYMEHLAKTGKCSIRELAPLVAVSDGTVVK